jgi:hypothetical protein
MTAFVQSLLFLSSYSPLFAVFALLDTFGRGWPSLVCLGIAILGVSGVPVLFLVDRGTAARPLEVTSASPRDSDVLAYIVSYLVPFADFEAASVRQRIAVIFFIGIVAILYVRLQLFYVNPLLALIGYRVYQATTMGGNSIALLSRRRFVAPASRLQAVRLSDYVWREKR